MSNEKMAMLSHDEKPVVVKEEPTKSQPSIWAKGPGIFSKDSYAWDTWLRESQEQLAKIRPRLGG